MGSTFRRGRTPQETLPAHGHPPPNAHAIRRKATRRWLLTLIVSIVLITILSIPLGPLPPIGGLANPGGGLWEVAEGAIHPKRLELAFPQLDGQVVVYRDPYGIPHIFATTEHDLFFAQGFVHAQDRLFQMDLTRRAAEGKLAEVFGARVGSFDVLETDTFVRTIGLGALAEQRVQEIATDDPTRVPLDAYAEGVNAYLRRAGGNLPLEFKLLDYAPGPWRPADSFAVGLLLAWSLSGSFEDLELSLLAEGLGIAVDELFPIWGPYQVPVDPRPGPRSVGAQPLHFAPEFREAARDLLRRARDAQSFLGGPLAGSNNWAIRGSRTDTGAPRLANDPHLQFQLPAIWYENHLVGLSGGGGTFNVNGVSLPGIPTVILGQNRRIAWGATNVGADVVDLYRETVDEAAGKYLYRGVWRDLEVRNEVIRVKGGAPITLAVKSTIHGPLVTERGQTLAMRWTGYEPGNLLRPFYEIDLATNWAEFRAALEHFTVPAQNFVYADVEHIGMRSNGLYPIRIRSDTLVAFDGRFPLNGSSGVFEWVDFVDFEAYPESVDPREGYVLSANQQPQHPGYVPYLGWSWDPGYRARRIQEMLAADDRVTAEEFKAMQLDTVDVMAREFAPFVADAVSGSCATATCTQALAAFSAWASAPSGGAFRMDQDKGAPAIWWRFANALRPEMFRDEWEAGGVADLMLPLPNVMEHLLKNEDTSHWFDDVRTGTIVEPWQDSVRRAWGGALDGLVADLGGDVSAWRWGDLHVRQFDHLTGLEALRRGPFPADGDALTVNVAAGEVARGGPSWRLLADLAPALNSKGIYPGGQSGNPASPHYDDLLEMWLAEEHHDLIFPANADAMPSDRIASTLILRRA